MGKSMQKSGVRYTSEFRRKMVELVRAGRTASELARLRSENRQLKCEREILSKAAAWFAQETAPNSKRSLHS